MRTIERSSIVPFPAEAMFDLVADVGRYPDFLPGCTAARIHEASGDVVIASMSLSKGPLQFELRTRNTMRRPERIEMHLDNGPFSRLEGVWVFSPIGDGGARVTLTMEFEFASGVVDAILGPVFEQLAGELLAAFSGRARALLAGPAGAPAQDS